MDTRPNTVWQQMTSQPTEKIVRSPLYFLYTFRVSQILFNVVQGVGHEHVDPVAHHHFLPTFKQNCPVQGIRQMFKETRDVLANRFEQRHFDVDGPVGVVQAFCPDVRMVRVCVNRPTVSAKAYFTIESDVAIEFPLYANHLPNRPLLRRPEKIQAPFLSPSRARLASQEQLHTVSQFFICKLAPRRFN